MSNIYEKTYIDEYGRKYVVSEPSSADIPEFGLDSDDGTLLYRTKADQNEWKFTVSDEGYLQSELDKLGSYY